MLSTLVLADVNVSLVTVLVVLGIICALLFIFGNFPFRR